ncbi:MAG: YbaN family protein, partial [Bacillota bacterium]
MRPVTRWLLLAAGSVALALGVLGLFLPLLPATPFLLLSAACYSRSSERFYRWLVNHRVLGTYIRNYVERRGVTMRAKLYTLGVLWTTMLIS